MARDEFNDTIEEVVRGNNFRVRREFTVSELAAGVGIAKARFMVKAAKTDTDAQALFFVLITEAATDAGRIVRDGTAEDRTCEVSFELTRANTRALHPGETGDWWSIRVKADDGAEYTPFFGPIKSIDEVQADDIP